MRDQVNMYRQASVEFSRIPPSDGNLRNSVEMTVKGTGLDSLSKRVKTESTES
jgi:hypothetical protein